MLDLVTRWLGPHEERSPEVRRDGLKPADERILDAPLFLADHAPPPVIDLATWRLEVFGTGLRGRPDAGHAVSFSYDDLLALPACTITATLGCAAHWTGPLLYDVLELAGITFDAISLVAKGLDEPVRQGGVSPAPVRGPFPVENALDDVLVAYAMNGRRLSPQQGFPTRLVVPESAVDSVMWLGRIEVLSRPSFSR